VSRRDPGQGFDRERGEHGPNEYNESTSIVRDTTSLELDWRKTEETDAVIPFIRDQLKMEIGSEQIAKYGPHCNSARGNIKVIIPNCSKWIDDDTATEGGPTSRFATPNFSNEFTHSSK
jgi:hypothetical protein